MISIVINCLNIFAILKFILTTVNRMQDATLELETNTDRKRIAELKEILADNLAELGNFSEAVEYYLATVR